MNSKNRIWLLVIAIFIVGIPLFLMANKKSWTDINLRPLSYEYPQPPVWNSRFENRVLSADEIEGLNRCYDYGRDMFFQEFFEDSGAVAADKIPSQYVTGISDLEIEGVSMGWQDGKKAIVRESNLRGESSVRDLMSVPTRAQLIFLIYLLLIIPAAFFLGIMTAGGRKGNNK